MLKRPKPGETEDDILRMEQEFLAQMAKNPKMRASADVVKVKKPTNKSLFAKSRAHAPMQPEVASSSSGLALASATTTSSNNANLLMGDLMHDVNAKRDINDLVIGDIIEKQFESPKTNVDAVTPHGNPKFQFDSSNPTTSKNPSIFGRSLLASNQATAPPLEDTGEQMECEPTTTMKLFDHYGSTSVVVADEKMAAEVHAQNVLILSQMRKEQILSERRKLLASIDSSVVVFLSNKRQKTKAAGNMQAIEPKLLPLEEPLPMDIESAAQDSLNMLPDSNPAHQLIQRSDTENWLNFDVVETDKLQWMRDIPELTAKLKPGEKFEARFDWKGVLLPYSQEQLGNGTETVRDERELYLHGADPNRPGYTLQELFRLARSNVLQQRISAFGAISGILNIYNQGFYDQGLELPISKIFFLLRYGLDDNVPAQLEVVSKALAFLFYNETDEIALDFNYENADCHWQPALPVLADARDADDPTSIENLQKQMQQLQMNSPTISANVEENEEDSKTSMTDFQLAETDLIDCLLRTNILQRIHFILESVRPDNSTVVSCLKLLIRLARSSYKIAEQIVKERKLHDCLMINFLPPMAFVDVTLPQPPFYGYPQYLYLKLLRVLISQHFNNFLNFKETPLIERLQEYLFNRENIRSKLIRVQIESLRMLRCLLLQRAIDVKKFKQFLPALRQMLDWHYNHCVYEVGGPALIRQHAAALLATFAASGDIAATEVEVQKLLNDPLHDCCCSWLHKATRGEGVKEHSQATLLSTCLNVLNWQTRHQSMDATRLQNIINTYVPDFVRSQAFVACVGNLTNASILLGTSSDRRNVHAALPNVGAVLMTPLGPQFVLTDTYAVQLLSALWRLATQQLAPNGKNLFNALIEASSFRPLVHFLQSLRTRLNRFLATNFFARSELHLVYQLLCVEGLNAYLPKKEMFQLAYNYLCCLPATQVHEIKILYERYIFNAMYIRVPPATLEKWHQTCLTVVYRHFVASRREMTFTLPYMQAPILPLDWPYFQLNIMLKNYVDNVQQRPAVIFSEREVLQMTFNFVIQLEHCGMQIVTPTEKLMYLMIAFMGPDSQFLADDMQYLLRTNVFGFYTQHADHTFDFDATYPDKCKFENLYALFVDHFQAASYGDELFSSLVLIPLAQKYDNKWRRRLWSDYGNALRFLNCDESMLLGGINAYLEPVEQEVSLLQAYAAAINSNLVFPGTLPYKIAKHHIDNYRPMHKDRLAADNGNG